MSTATKARKLKRKKSTTYLGSWNLQGKATHLADLAIMSQDMKTRKIAICAMQETMNEYAGETRMENGDCYIFFGKQANGYGGLGFYVTSPWVTRIANYRRIN